MLSFLTIWTSLASVPEAYLRSRSRAFESTLLRVALRCSTPVCSHRGCDKLPDRQMQKRMKWSERISWVSVMTRGALSSKTIFAPLRHNDSG
ncbi:hypothetical protein BDV18DRAFT_43573 [Aspergillus unguis]